MKEKVTAIDMNAAFKALDEMEYPIPEKGIKATRLDLQEVFTKKLKTDKLVEDYYNIASQEDLQEAREDIDADVAKAKLERIEKIVDLDAKSEDDLLTSYVGKDIMQCPQCMTLFYKDPADIVKAEDSDYVNIGEKCQHCGNDSGYTLIGKVAEESNTPEETPTEEMPVETNTEEELPDTSDMPTDETATEETSAEDIQVEETDVDNESDDEDKPKTESLQESAEEDEDDEADYHDSFITDACWYINKTGKTLVYNKNDVDEILAKFDEFMVGKTNGKAKNIKASQLVVTPKDDMFEISVPKTTTESLHEDVDITDELDDYNKYIEDLQERIKVLTDKVKNEKNKYIKGSMQKTLEDLQDELDDMLPDTLKDEVAVEELPSSDVTEETATETDSTEKVDETNVKESLTEAVKEDKPIDITYSESAVDDMLDSKEFTTPISDEEVQSYFNENKEETLADKVTDIDEKRVSECLTESLTKVYENVNSFTVTNCSMPDKNKILIEGKIKFTSGNTKTTSYLFEMKKAKNNDVLLCGLNESINGEFKLHCRIGDVGDDKVLLAERLKYRYSVDKTLVEGLIKK